MTRNPYGWDYPPGAEHHPDAPWIQKQDGIEISVLEDAKAGILDAIDSLKNLKNEVDRESWEELTTVGWNQIGILTYLREIADNLSRRIREEEEGE